ncbi:MAG: hypothetical protein MUP28_01865 [Candidatus Aminicenantes bacterium]|nr:hypothetical protein [Candidatus Aminicenantes bacterium]
MRKRVVFGPAAALLAALMIAAPADAQTVKKAPAVPAAFWFAGWAPYGQVRKYTKKNVADRLEGSAEIFLQYGFTDLTVHHFRPAVQAKKTAGKEIALEIYRMETPADAFGIFSVRRSGAEKVSEIIKTLNWISPARASFVKGNAYVNILATGCEEAEVEKVAAAAAAKINLPGDPVPAEVARLPKTNLVPGSERYIRGGLAAWAETPFLGRDFWGFRTDKSRAATARYAPKDSKLIVLDLGPEATDVTGLVEGLFKEYLEDVTMADGLVRGEDAVGSSFLFEQKGRAAALVLGETDREAAKARLAEALTGPGE